MYLRWSLLWSYRVVSIPMRFLRTVGTEAIFFPEYSEFTYISSSPNGDRPEWHWWSLEGTVPITELDPVLFRHLEAGQCHLNNTIVPDDMNAINRVYGKSEFDLRGILIEYVDVTVGRSLRCGYDSRRPQSFEKAWKRTTKSDGLNIEH
jgi:hypothetical protein